ncbi:MAG: chemotaxis protein MotB [Gaiellales bacterium]|jgi:chemotaxis protein MotB|nr:chemotaxis protein MotB [Gaiellales bacterium]
MSGGGHGGRRKKHEEHEEHENHERWLVSYADMMTLLMVLFIVMFAISQVDQKKFMQLKNGLAVGFGEQSAAFSGSTGTLDDNGQAPAPMSLASQNDNPKTKTDAEKELEKQAVAAADRTRGEENLKAAEKEVQSLAETKAKIDAELKKHGQQSAVRYRIDERGLVISVVTSDVIFPGDMATLLPAGATVLRTIGPVIGALPNGVEVDGHTNHLGVANPQYPTSWELSAARAARVVRYFADNHYVSAKRMMATGFGSQKPLYPVTDPRAIKLNRRVDVIVLSALPADQRALLPAAAAANKSTAGLASHDETTGGTP